MDTVELLLLLFYKRNIFKYINSDLAGLVVSFSAFPQGEEGRTIASVTLLKEAVFQYSLNGFGGLLVTA
ncbi:hypothetical protein [Desulfogranum marinum]|uniref:hypothetical protein n=1 Tax=Desulfogranum marinum TaxID=453220 RepID=UPI0019650E69|nr:hypothetical protein [Desulfogranum marinum]MBM9514111.1 hypothetical protein [Desulfogranum marinum]